MTSPAYSAAQQITGGGGSWGVPRWQAPLAPNPPLTRDRSLVVRSTPVEWPAAIGKVAVMNGSQSVPWLASLSGMPLNVSSPATPWRFVTTQSPWFPRMSRRVQVPVDPWIEGHPRVPLFPWDVGPGAWDRHCIIVGPDSIIEMIGFDPRYNTCLGYAEIGLDGALLPGSDGWMCAGQVSIARHTITADSFTNPHVSGIVIPDYSGWDGSLPAGVFPKVGDRLRLAQVPLAVSLIGGHALAVAKMLHTHGCRVIDRSGGPVATLWVASGAHLNGSNIDQLRLPLSSFHLVTT